MDEPTVRKLIEDVRSGALDPDAAVVQLRRLPFADLGYAKVDHHRGLRQSTGEAVYAPGKSPEQCAGIVAELLASGTEPVVMTRADAIQVAAVSERSPAQSVTPTGATSTLTWRHGEPRTGNILIATAGTSDLPVAHECSAVLVALGFEPRLLADCGVAGVHRLLANVDLFADADVVVVIAGMEGALASIVGGITPAPVIAVPTSTGYGSSFEGITALLAMLASCAAGLAVVGIDNGFGAACAVARMLPKGAATANTL
jgi:NCAIR mutase (PurE)-related protein